MAFKFIAPKFVCSFNLFIRNIDLLLKLYNQCLFKLLVIFFNLSSIWMLWLVKRLTSTVYFLLNNVLINFRVSTELILSIWILLIKYWSLREFTFDVWFIWGLKNLLAWKLSLFKWDYLGFRRIIEFIKDATYKTNYLVSQGLLNIFCLALHNSITIGGNSCITFILSPWYIRADYDIIWYGLVFFSNHLWCVRFLYLVRVSLKS